MFLKGQIMFASVATSAMTLRRVETKGTFTRLAATLRLGLAAYEQRQSLRGLDAARLDAVAKLAFERR